MQKDKQLERLILRFMPYHVLPVGSEAEAKMALREFMQHFSSLKPIRNTSDNIRCSQSSYLIELIPMECALKRGAYELACHELLTLHAYEPLLEIRIYANLLRLYETYLR